MGFAVIWYRGHTVIGMTPWPPSLDTAEKYAREHLAVRAKHDRVTKVEVIDVDHGNAVLVSILREEDR